MALVQKTDMQIDHQKKKIKDQKMSIQNFSQLLIVDKDAKNIIWRGKNQFQQMVLGKLNVIRKNNYKYTYIICIYVCIYVYHLEQKLI